MVTQEIWSNLVHLPRTSYSVVAGFRRSSLLHVLHHQKPASLLTETSSVDGDDHSRQNLLDLPKRTMQNCEVFAVFTLIINAIWVYNGRKWSFQTLSLAMLLPGLFVPWFVDDPEFLNRILGIGKFNACLQFSVIGGIISMVAISVCLLVNQLTGWGKIDERAEVEDTTADLVTGFLRAAGEEVGWRCYLLPCLIQQYGRINALIISGVVWSLFHVPTMLVLVHRHPQPRPYCAILARTAYCLLSAFPHGWVAIKSGFALWPPTMMHYTWNRLNPVVMGNIYKNKPGKVIGPQWLVNGEGVAGCIAILPVTGFVIHNLLTT